MSTITTTSEKNAALAVQPQARAAAPASVTHDLIRRRAYDIYRARNGGPGNPLSDWVQAERELAGAPQAAAFVVHSRKRRRANDREAISEQPFRDGVLYA